VFLFTQEVLLVEIFGEETSSFKEYLKKQMKKSVFTILIKIKNTAVLFGYVLSQKIVVKRSTST